MIHCTRQLRGAAVRKPTATAAEGATVSDKIDLQRTKLLVFSVILHIKQIVKAAMQIMHRIT